MGFAHCLPPQFWGGPFRSSLAYFFPLLFQMVYYAQDSAQFIAWKQVTVPSFSSFTRLRGRALPAIRHRVMIEEKHAS
jgi:hypothetical protein